MDWARRFLEYVAPHGATARPHVDTAAVRDYLTHLAVRQRVSSSTQNQALCAILFLCREVLGIDVQELSTTVRARRGLHLPVVLSVPETAALLAAMHGTAALMASLIYGGGLRVSECCELRIKDVDFDQGLLAVRGGKGNKDRTTLLGEGAREVLRAQIARAEVLFGADRKAGLAVFPSQTLSTDPRAGIVRRHHISESVVQKAVKAAAATAKISKPVSVHTLRHCFATHLLLNGVDIRQIQELLGHAHVETTMDLHARGQRLAKSAAESSGHSSRKDGLDRQLNVAIASGLCGSLCRGEKACA